jgi:hypothetical protein
MERNLNISYKQLWGKNMKGKDHKLLTITAREFGPIKEGKVTLKPFTIFFGKNNTGKTYMGYLVWGIIKNDPIIGRKAQGYSKLSKLIKNYILSKSHASLWKFPFGVYEYVGDVEIIPTILFTARHIRSLFNFPIQLKEAKATLPIPIKFKVGIALKERGIPKDKSVLERFKKVDLPDPLKPIFGFGKGHVCLLYTSPSPRDS